MGWDCRTGEKGGWLCCCVAQLSADGLRLRLVGSDDGKQDGSHERRQVRWTAAKHMQEARHSKADGTRAWT